MFTLLKLLTDLAFKNCLSFHMENGVKLSEGGFGVIYRVECSCDVYEHECSQHPPKSYAVKRIPRERSKYDNPMLYDVFNEVHILETLQAVPTGVCKLVDYGINNGEYWLVMDCGDRDLLRWRQAVTCLAPLECLLLYTEALLIIESVHSNGIVHFDIKAANFIFATSADTQVKARCRSIRDSHQEHRPAGILQVIDFGEALFMADTKVDRSRGTLAILSPEMFALNTSNTSTNGDVVTPSYASDIWSLGCLLAEIFLGHFLFQDIPWPEMYVTLCMSKDKYQPINDKIIAELNQVIPSEYVRHVKDILVKVLQQSPESRPAISTIIADVSKLIDIMDLDMPVSVSSMAASSATSMQCIPRDLQETVGMLHEKVVTINETVVRVDELFLCITGSPSENGVYNTLENIHDRSLLYPLNEGIAATADDSDNTSDQINNEVFNVIFNASLMRYNQSLFNRQIMSNQGARYHVVSISSAKNNITKIDSEYLVHHVLTVATDPLQLRQAYQRILQIVKGAIIIIILHPSSKPNSFSSLAVSVAIALVEELTATTEHYQHRIRSAIPEMYVAHNKMVGSYLNAA